MKKSSKRNQLSRESTERSKASLRSNDTDGMYDYNLLQQTVTDILGIKRYEDWILNLNIGNVMHLSPLGLQEMNLQLGKYLK